MPTTTIQSSSQLGATLAELGNWTRAIYDHIGMGLYDPEPTATDVTIEDVAAMMGVPPSTVKANIPDLIRAGLVFKTKGGHLNTVEHLKGIQASPGARDNHRTQIFQWLRVASARCLKLNKGETPVIEVDEIAAQTGIPLGTVRNALHQMAKRGLVIWKGNEAVSIRTKGEPKTMSATTPSKKTKKPLGMSMGPKAPTPAKKAASKKKAAATTPDKKKVAARKRAAAIPTKKKAAAEARVAAKKAKAPAKKAAAKRGRGGIPGVKRGPYKKYDPRATFIPGVGLPKEGTVARFIQDSAGAAKAGKTIKALSDHVFKSFTSLQGNGLPEDDCRRMVLKSVRLGHIKEA